jgi:hypothetical protein
MRLPLEGGQWADLRDRLTYGQGHAVRVALMAVDADRTATVDLDIALVRAYVSAWNVLDLDGNAVPLDQPETAPDDVIQAIALAGIQAWKGKLDPKGMTALSATTSKARQSKQRTS